mgnify:CR=1 FL=1
MKAFSDSLKENIQLIQEDVNDQITDIAVSMFRDVVSNSPSYDLQDSVWSEGWLINQWYPSLKRPTKELNESKNSMGYDSLNRIYELNGTKHFYKKDNSIFLTNNVPYGEYAEILGWKKSINPKWQNHPAYAMMDKALIKKKAELG